MSHIRNIRIANTIIEDSRLIKAAAGKYQVNEIFYSIQGEGGLSGTAMTFLRFSQCNLRCTVKNSGFDCDTEFASFRELQMSEILTEIHRLSPAKGWVLLTGGEPALQADTNLISTLKNAGFKLAIETNGTIKLPEGLDWVCVSPKSAEHTIRQKSANEVRYVRSYGMGLPQTSVSAEHYFISPAFQPDGRVLKQDLDWCTDLVKESAGQWRLSLQSHKLLGLR